MLANIRRVCGACQPLGGPGRGCFHPRFQPPVSPSRLSAKRHSRSRLGAGRGAEVSVVGGSGAEAGLAGLFEAPPGQSFLAQSLVYLARRVATGGDTLAACFIEIMDCL